jgi:hypothetical protein
MMRDQRQISASCGRAKERGTMSNAYVSKIGVSKIGVSKILGRKWTFALGAGLAMILDCACAQGTFPLEGIFTQNEVCKGDGSQQQYLRVKITPEDVSYAGGVCTIDMRQLDGNVMAMRVTCKFSSGAVLASSISFTMKDNNTFDMAQTDGTYRAVLHRCTG